MTPDAFLHGIVLPAAGILATGLPHLDTPESRLMLLAIAGQESGWQDRLQQPVGYAHGFWQCEKAGAVIAVLTSEATKPSIDGLCAALCIPNGLDTVFEAITWNDALAYGLARLNLLLDPHPLPAIGDTMGAWNTYLRVWRPGKPDQDRWHDVYHAALAGAYPVTNEEAAGAAS